jgi:tripartite-type tricarboxylate transporter receptor subunit TctC
MPFPAAGPVDVLARALTEHARGQAVIVENISGAAGGIEVGRVARAAPERLHVRHRQSQNACLQRRDLLADPRYRYIVWEQAA